MQTAKWMYGMCVALLVVSSLWTSTMETSQKRPLRQVLLPPFSLISRVSFFLSGQGSLFREGIIQALKGIRREIIVRRPRFRLIRLTQLSISLEEKSTFCTYSICFFAWGHVCVRAGGEGQCLEETSLRLNLFITAILCHDKRQGVFNNKCTKSM